MEVEKTREKFMKIYLKLIFLLLPVICMAEGTLFVGLEGSSPQTFYSDMEGFPSVNWTGHFSHDVSGAAATPEGRIYLCEGAFTTHLYQATLESSPSQLCTIDEDMSALAFGRDTLWGYSNYASPKGIYSIDVSTGAVELALDTGSRRFFALDYNPEDDLFYGYTEYGGSGLYSIDIDTGEMNQLSGSIPAVNGQGRGMAVGDNTVYLTATRGDDGVPYFAYDISQGAGGNWVEFPNPYPQYHSTGGAAWIAAPDELSDVFGQVISSDFQTGEPDCEVTLTGEETYIVETDEDGMFLLADLPNHQTYNLEIYKDGFDLYVSYVSIEETDIDLGAITLMETAMLPENVTAIETIPQMQVTVSWDDPPFRSRMLEGYNVYRLLECFNTEPELWELMVEETYDNEYVDDGWSELPENTWQYAVEAVYTNGIYSEAVLSEPLEKIITGNESHKIKEAGSIVSSIYPNPFNPETSIEYQVACSGQVLIEVYNLRGQRIKTLLDAYQSAGNYSLLWKADSIDSGVYFIRLSTGETNQIKKVILLK